MVTVVLGTPDSKQERQPLVPVHYARLQEYLRIQIFRAFDGVSLSLMKGRQWTLGSRHRVHYSYSTMIQGESGAATSLPLPFDIPGYEEVGGGIWGGGVDGTLAAGELAANCHAGIEGFPGRMGVEGPVDMLGPLLRSRALRDLSSCCSSASD